MSKIIPGYFIPIWQEIIFTKRNYACELISQITLIPLNTLLSNAYFYSNKEEYLKYHSDDGIKNINIYFDYKYCIVDISKDLYKSLLLEGEKNIINIDSRKKYFQRLKICISFTDSNYLITKSWVNKNSIDYLFLNIGISYLKAKLKSHQKTSLEKLLIPLVVEDTKELDKFYQYSEITLIIKRHNNNKYFQNWYRTYQEYLNNNKFLNIISTLY